jgi:Zn-dependent protease with chaperone function
MPHATDSASTLHAGAVHMAGRPAARAAARLGIASLVLWALGLGSVALVLVRLLESWRITPASTSHRVTIFGQTVSYPAANVDAIVILALALVSVIASLLLAHGAVHEIRSSRRFARELRRRCRWPLGEALVIDHDRPLAFCAGLLRPHVYISSAALALLDSQALAAVLAHERHHAVRRDPLRAAATRVLIRAFFYVPGLERVAARREALAELSADESVVLGAGGNRTALARAMLNFTQAPGQGFDADRVDYLLGEPPAWRFPVAAWAGAAGVIVAILLVALLAGQVASGSASLALPLLSRQPCVVTLALIGAALVALAAWSVRARD